MEDYFNKTIFSTKGKQRKYHLLEKDIFLDVKLNKTQLQQTLHQSRDLENGLLDSEAVICHISNEIWYYVSKYIPPEDVRSFALICRQTAALVNTKSFWKNIYLRYVNRTNRQIENINNCDIKTLRTLVIRCLFSCYPPLMEKLFTRNTLGSLIGRIYCTSWNWKIHQNWIMCFKFKSCHRNNKTKINKKTSTVVDNWELLDENDEISVSNNVNASSYYEGEWLLVLFCRNFAPFPSHLIYENENRVRLLGARTLLTEGLQICGVSLEFVDTISNEKTIVNYPQALKYNVVPWWHPQFDVFLSHMS